MTDQIADIFAKYLSFNPKETDPLVEDMQLRNWMLNVMDLCQNAHSFDEAIKNINPRKNEYSTRIGFQDELPYSSLLQAYVYFKWGKYSYAAETAKNAVDEFKACAKTGNQAIALWIRALALEQEKHIESAQKDIESAIFLIERKLSDYKRFPRMNGKHKDYENIRDKLHKANERLQRELRSNISNVRPAPPPPPVHPPPPPPAPPAPAVSPAPVAAPNIQVRVPIDITLSNSMKATVSSEAEASQSANIINANSTFPLDGQDLPRIHVSPGRQTPPELDEITLPWLPLLVHPTAQANPHGKGYIIEGDTESPTEISHITIEGQLCEIHLVKNTTKSRDHMVRLISSRRYKWMRIAGHSMKDYDPKIEDGDYALFYDLETSSMENLDYDLVYQDDATSPPVERSKLPNDNIVIVKEVDRATEEDNLLIKKYKSSENLLYSYNNEKQNEYKPRALCEECQILGIVVAIAKPPRE